MEVRANIAGPTIEILVNGNVSSSHVSTVAENFYSIGVVLQTNQKVTARQTFSGTTSPASPPVIVESIPSQLSALTVQTHLHSCGRAVWASGAVPGANVQALIGNQTVGSANSANGDAVIICNPTVSAGQDLTLRQTACNNATASQVTPAAVAPPSPLPPPQIQQPLIECQNSISIGGVVDGAYVEIYRNNNTVPEQLFTFGLSQEWFWIKPLANNDVIKVRQGFSCKQPAPPLETTSPFGSATVQPISQLNAPQFLEFLADACRRSPRKHLGRRPTPDSSSSSWPRSPLPRSRRHQGTVPARSNVNQTHPQFQRPPNTKPLTMSRGQCVTDVLKLHRSPQRVQSPRDIGGRDHCPCGEGEQSIRRGIGQCYNSPRGSGKEELMKKALIGASVAAVIAPAPLCIPPAQAHADDPCVSITDAAAHQACIDEFLRDDPMHRYQMGDCQGSPDYGAEGQFCRNFWVRKSAPPASRQLSEL